MSPFQYKIKLGDIRPTNEIKVSVWFEESDFDKDKAIITYPDGVIKIVFPFHN